MYWWWPRSWCRAFIYTIKSISLIHGLDSRSFLMELVFAACCFVFPVWALSLQSYEGDHEDDFDFLWKLWLDTANKILLSLQINGLLYGGVLVLNRGLFLLWAFPRSLSLRWIENRGINDDIPSQGPGDCWFFSCCINDGSHRDQSGLNVSEPFPDLLAVFSSHYFLSLVIHKRTTLFVIGCLVDVVCEVVFVRRSMATQSTPPAFPPWILYGFQPWAIGHQGLPTTIHWVVWLNLFTYLPKHQLGLEITHGCHDSDHLAMDLSSRRLVFFHGTPILFPQLGQLFLVLEEVRKLIDLMPCVWLSPSIHTIAEFIPKHITHSGDLLSPFLHPFSACGLELIQQRLRNRVLTKVAMSTL